MVVVLTGPAGAGKSTVGRALAAALGWTFTDADDLHTPESVAKMRRGIGLSDEDRWPWLARVRATIESAVASRADLVVACSALREEYRRYLTMGFRDVRIVFLRGTPTLLESRLSRRGGHFAAASLLHSQLEALEPPRDALTLDASLPVPVLVALIRASLT